MRRLSLLVVIGALMLFAAGCGDNNSAPTQPVMVTPPAATPTPSGQPTRTPTPGPTTRIVNVGPGNIFMDTQSNTSMTTIRAGETVQWNFVDSIGHSTTSGTCCTASGLWDSGVKSSGSFSHQFAAAGTFPYFCTVHGAMMTGTVVVNP